IELDDLIVFALDRIKSITDLDKRLIPKINKSFNPHDYFKNVFGIVRYNLNKPASKPQKVILESKSDWAYYYLKQYKIHPSQKVITDKPEEQYLKIELFIEINIDLILLLHKQRTEIRVIKPNKLINEIIGFGINEY